MAIKSVFTVKNEPPYFEKHDIEFRYNMGLSLSQKRKNVQCVHNIFNKTISSIPILEISSKSEDEIGVRLSAFNLCKYVPSLKKNVSVECIYQSAKLFENGGPFNELLLADSKTAKKDERLKTSGNIIGFTYEGNLFPIAPKWAFYNYLYMSALRENNKLSEYLLNYNAFSDIEFSPNSINCQATAAAQYAGLYSAHKLEAALSSFEAYIEICVGKSDLN